MRRTIGTKKPEGLTATYNRFHDANERSADIATLRALHAEMDRAVLAAYGWEDVKVPPYGTPVSDAEKKALERCFEQPVPAEVYDALAQQLASVEAEKEADRDGKEA